MDSLNLPTAALKNLTISDSVHPSATENVAAALENLTLNSTKVGTHVNGALRNPKRKPKKPRVEIPMNRGRRLFLIGDFIRIYYNRKNNRATNGSNPNAHRPEKNSSLRECRRRSRLIVRMGKRGILDKKTVERFLEFEKKNPNSKVGNEISRLMRIIGETKVEDNGKIGDKFIDRCLMARDVYNLITTL